MSVLDWALNRPYLPPAMGVLFLLALAAILWAGRRRRPARPPRERRRTPAAVRLAAFAAAVCTAYSADTSWRFADERLDIAETAERIMMFGAGEVALLACAQMARHNNRTTGSPGTPGTIIWLVTGVQVFAAYSISDFAGGTVRAILGPVMAVLLWHLAMGIDLRHAKPGANSQALTAVVARELRERLLSWLGLAARDRTAEQITRDRATTRAVALAARLAEIPPEKRGDRRARRIIRRLSKAVGAAEVGANEGQRQKLVGLLAARRHASGLATVALPSPWDERRHAICAGRNGTLAVQLLMPEPVPASEPTVVPAQLASVPAPEALAVPEQNRTLVPARPAPRKRNSRARAARKPARKTTFDQDVLSARAWLSNDPELSGAEIGRKLGKSDRHGRNVRAAASGIAAPGREPRPNMEGGYA